MASRGLRFELEEVKLSAWGDLVLGGLPDSFPPERLDGFKLIVDNRFLTILTDLLKMEVLLDDSDDIVCKLVELRRDIWSSLRGSSRDQKMWAMALVVSR